MITLLESFSIWKENYSFAFKMQQIKAVFTFLLSIKEVVHF